jgi:hypothetical protein
MKEYCLVCFEAKMEIGGHGRPAPSAGIKKSIEKEEKRGENNFG